MHVSKAELQRAVTGHVAQHGFRVVSVLTLTVHTAELEAGVERSIACDVRETALIDCIHHGGGAWGRARGQEGSVLGMEGAAGSSIPRDVSEKPTSPSSSIKTRSVEHATASVWW